MDRRPDGQVNVNAQRGRPSWLLPAALLAALALAVAAWVLFLGPRGGGGTSAPNTSPAATPTVAAASPTSTTATSTTGASPTATAAVSPASTGTAAVGAVPSDALGFAAQEMSQDAPLRLFSETSAQPVQTLAGLVLPAVSPDGRRIAAWMGAAPRAGRQLVTFVPGQTPTTLIELGPEESGGRIAWSQDGTGITFGATKGSPGGIGGAGGESYWRTVDVSTKTVRELGKLTDGRIFAPVAWLRGGSEIVAAIETGEGGFISAYYVWRPGGQPQRQAMPAGRPGAFSVDVSQDGRRVLAAGDDATQALRTFVWIWPVEDVSRAVTLRPADGDVVCCARFRPGSDEIGVGTGVMNPGSPTAARFEIWTESGQKRVVRRDGGFQRFRVDGSAALSWDRMLVDVRTGATSQLPAERYTAIGALLLR